MHGANTWKFIETPGTSMSGNQCEENDGGKELTVKAKRKRALVFRKKKRGTLAWERNVRNRSEEHGVCFGAEG